VDAQALILFFIANPFNYSTAAPQTLREQFKYSEECTYDQRETELQRKIAKLKLSEKV
jgi:hypothetical protein